MWFLKLVANLLLLTIFCFGQIKVGSTSARPSNPRTGHLYFNTTDSVLQVYDGYKWQEYRDGDSLFTDISDSLHAVDDSTLEEYSSGRKLRVKDQGIYREKLSENVRPLFLDMERAGSRSNAFHGLNRRTNAKVQPAFTLNDYDVVSDSLKILYRYTNIDTVGEDSLYNLADDSSTTARLKGNPDVSDGIAFTADTTNRMIFNDNSIDMTTEEATFEFLLELTSLDDGDLMTLSQASSNSRYFRVYLTSNEMAAQFRFGTVKWDIVSRTDLALNTKYHIVIRKDQYAASIFIEGLKEEATDAEDIWTVYNPPSYFFPDTSTGSMTYNSLGTRYRSNTAENPIACKLYEFKYYNRALSDVEIEVNYEKTKLITDRTPTYPIVDGGLYEFPFPEGFLHPVGAIQWGPAFYNKYTNSVDLVFMGRLIDFLGSDTSYAYLLKFDLYSMSFAYPVINLGHNKRNATEYESFGSLYDWGHYQPYSGLMKDQIIASWGSHNSLDIQVNCGLYGDDILSTLNMPGNNTYQLMSYEFSDEVWTIPRSPASGRRDHFVWDGEKWNDKLELFIDAGDWTPYMQRPYFEIRGDTAKRAVLYFTMEDGGKSILGHHAMGIMEIEEDGSGGYNYYDKLHQSITVKTDRVVDSTGFADSCLVYTPTSDSTYAWGEAIVDGDSLGFGFAENMPAAVTFYRRKGTGGSWESVTAVTDTLEYAFKLYDYTYDADSQDVYILWGSTSSTWAANYAGNIRTARTSDTLFISKINDFWGTPTYSVIDTTYINSDGDSTGVYYPHFIHGFIAATRFIGVTIKVTLGSPDNHDTSDARYFYYFKEIQ